MEYMTLHMPQLNGVIEIRYAVIHEGALAVLMNAKLNETSQKMLWEKLFIRASAYKKYGEYR